MSRARHPSPLVSDVMRRFFVTAGPWEPLAAAHQTMRLGRLRHLLVTEGEGHGLLGIASYRDVVEALLQETTRLLETTARTPADLHAGTLQSVMAPLPVVVHPTTPLAEAARQLCRHRYGCLPVVEDAPGEERHVVGLVTETDLLRAAFESGRRPRGRRLRPPD